MHCLVVERACDQVRGSKVTTRLRRAVWWYRIGAGHWQAVYANDEDAARATVLCQCPHARGQRLDVRAVRCVTSSNPIGPEPLTDRHKTVTLVTHAMTTDRNQHTTARNVPRVIDRLTVAQRAAGWTDAEVAERLGISRSGWAHLRTGWRNPGIPLLRSLLREFPELREEALAYLEHAL